MAMAASRVAGDFREYQGTMWAHDHRFFFTAENVYKGMLMMINYYSAKIVATKSSTTAPTCACPAVASWTSATSISTSI